MIAFYSNFSHYTVLCTSKCKFKFVRTMYVSVVFYSSLNFAVSTPHQAGIMKVRSASVDKNYERKPFLKLRENSTEKAKTTKEKS